MPARARGCPDPQEEKEPAAAGAKRRWRRVGEGTRRCGAAAGRDSAS